VKQYIGCDAHTRFSVFVSVDETGKVGNPFAWITAGRIFEITWRSFILQI
jgi:hypothetical protein